MKKDRSNKKQLAWKNIVPMLFIVALFGWIGGFWYGSFSGKKEEKMDEMNRIQKFLNTEQLRSDARSYCQSRIDFLRNQGGPVAQNQINHLEIDIEHINQGNIFWNTSSQGITWNELLNDARMWNMRS